jgi:hypothetical protein
MVIDRIEGDVAIIENGDKYLNILLKNLPQNVKEGDILDENFQVDTAQKAEKQQKLKEMEIRLKKRK